MPDSKLPSQAQGAPLRGSAAPLQGLPTRWVAALGKALLRSEGRPRYGFAQLSQGVCCGCSLGSSGLRDSLGGPWHLCPAGLAEMREHSAQAFVGADVMHAERLGRLDAEQLHELGHVPYPFALRPGELGFTRLSWEEAVALLAASVGSHREAQAWLANPRGVANEELFAFAETARRLGMERPGRLGGRGLRGRLAERIGVGASPASTADLQTSDLVLVWGPELGADAGVVERHLARARRRGARVVAIGTPGLRADDTVPGAPQDFAGLGRLLGRLLLRAGAVDREAFRARCVDADLHLAALEGADVDALLARGGLQEGRVEWLASLLARAGTVCSVVTGMEGLEAALDLHLLLGAFGRPGSGLLICDGRSGQQGAVDLGLEPADEHTLAGAGLAVILGSGASLSREALAAVGTRVHVVERLDPSVLAPTSELTLLLPLLGRHLLPGGHTLTSTDRRVRFSPQLQGAPPSVAARSARELFSELLRAVDPALAEGLRWDGGEEVRAAMAASVPRYEGVAALRQPGDQLQWGDARLLAEDAFSELPDGKALLSETARG